MCGGSVRCALGCLSVGCWYAGIAGGVVFGACTLLCVRGEGDGREGGADGVATACARHARRWVRRRALLRLRGLSRLCLLVLLLRLLAWSVRDVDGVAVACVGAIGEGRHGGGVRCQRVRLCVGLVMGDHWHGV